MTVTEYPTFVAGQSLTADELNLLADHTFERDRLLGRLIGFGVNAGLSGKLTTNTLTVKAGLAVDQSGEPLVMRDDWTRTFPTSGAPAGLSTIAYPFIQAAPDVYSVVLVAEEDDTDEVTCGELDCAGHAKLHTRKVRVDLVAGKVNSSRFIFEGDAILTAVPLLMQDSGSITGSVTDLKDKITAGIGKLTPALSGVTMTNLANFTITASEVTAVKAYKAAWINRLLFAVIAALRCQALAGLSAFRDDAVPGVVLGAMERKTTGWEFHCDWRHAWEPPTGLSAALIGGSCSNVCGPARDYVRDALNNYGPPTPPPTSTPPTGGRPDLVYCPGGRRNCFVELVPGKKQFRPIIDIFIEQEPPVPNPGYIDPAPDDYYTIGPIHFADPVTSVRTVMDEVFGSTPTNVLGDGYLNATPLVGLKGEIAQEIAVDHMGKHGGAGVAITMPAGELMKTPGAQRAMTFSPSDTLALGVDTAGNVVDMAIVPAMTALRGTAAMTGKVEQARADAAVATKAAGDLSLQFTTGMAQVDGTLKALQGSYGQLAKDFGEIKGSPANQAVLMHRVQVLEEQGSRVEAMGERLSKLEGRALAQVGDLGVKTYTTDVGNGMAEFAQTALQAMKTIEQPRSGNFKEQLAAVERSQAALELAVRTGDPAKVAETTVGLLDTMRTVIGGAGADAGTKRKLDAQFRAMQELLG